MKNDNESISLFMKRLTEPFDYSDIGWVCKDKGGGLYVPYVRAVPLQNRLDDVIGPPNWQTEYAAIGNPHDKDPYCFICRLSLNFGDQGWIHKSNGAGITQFASVKGGLSDSFKRAASAWGIGRYLANVGGVNLNAKSADNERKKLEHYAKKVHELYPDWAAQNAQVRQVLQNLPVPEQFQVVSSQEDQQQSYLVLMRPNGEQVAGYFKGRAGVAQGQIISDVTFSQAGGYTVINQFKKTA